MTSPETEWLSLPDAAAQYGIPPSTLRWHCRRGALAYCARKVTRRGGSKYEVPRDAVHSLAKLLATRKTALHEMRNPNG